MALLPLVMGNKPIFRQKCKPLATVTDETRQLMDDMLETMYHEDGVGMGAPMVGVSEPVVVIDMRDVTTPKPLFMANPVITDSSEELQTFTEASLCFPGIKADITRPKSITVEFLDYEGNSQNLSAEGFFSTTIQHEIDYLNGKLFFDYLSSLKRDRLLKKFEKLFKKHCCITGTCTNHK